MAICNCRFGRLFVFMLLLAALCSATDEQYQHDYGKSSSGGHDADNNRTVVLNRASEQYLAMIFQDYSDNSSGRISAPRFKDLLQDLSLGEPVISEKSTRKHSKDSVERDHRHTRSYNGPPGKLAREFAGQQRRQNRHSVGEFKDAPNSRYFVSHENRANSRDRKRRDEHSDSHNDNEQVSLKKIILIRVLRLLVSNISFMIWLLEEFWSITVLEVCYFLSEYVKETLTHTVFDRPPFRL